MQSGDAGPARRTPSVTADLATVRARATCRPLPSPAAGDAQPRRGTAPRSSRRSAFTCRPWPTWPQEAGPTASPVVRIRRPPGPGAAFRPARSRS